VRALKEQFSISGNRLVPRGVGMAAPIGSNASEDGRALNRRVEIVLR
jgi:outer membrane protein OmpA-like peptidoglycan-associated protein